MVEHYSHTGRPPRSVPQIIRSALAEADALEIWVYIAQDDPSAADRLIARFDKLFHTLAEQPLMGRSFPKFADKLRVAVVGNYLVFYRPVNDGIQIVRILQSARDISIDYFRE
jgi:toxin ParE1/3/4